MIVVNDDATFKNSMVYLRKLKSIAVDTETTGIDPHTSKVLIISMGDFRQQYVFDVARLKQEHIKEIAGILESQSILKLLQNAKFDYKALAVDLNIRLNNVYDTMLTEQVLTRGRKNISAGLADLVEKYVGVVLSKEIRSSFADMHYGNQFSKEQLEYAGRDVEYLHAIQQKQLEVVKKEALEKVIELENLAVLPTGDMEINGIYLDPKKWLALEDDAYKERLAAEKALDEFFIPVVGTDLLGNADINYNSPSQLVDALSKILPSPISSTKEEYLKTIDHPVIKALLDYREKQKQISTYGAAFFKYINTITQRIHPNFLQVMGTDSGRYSCQDPNLQNIPAKPEYREPFCVQHDYNRIVGADYSGMELRLLAELSLDPVFLEIFDKKLDPHGAVGQMITGKEIRQKGTLGPDDPGLNLDLRKHVKTLNFGVAYGMGPKRLSVQTGMPYNQAKQLIAAFWKKFPGVKKFFDERVEYAIKNRCALSPLDGRKRWLLDFDFDAIKNRVHAENIAKNFPLQGGNASILKKALCMVRERIVGKRIMIINTIHDEILLEAHHEDAEEAKQILQECMISAAELYVKRVPITVESYISTHWKK